MLFELGPQAETEGIRDSVQYAGEKYRKRKGELPGFLPMRNHLGNIYNHCEGEVSPHHPNRLL